MPVDSLSTCVSINVKEQQNFDGKYVYGVFSIFTDIWLDICRYLPRVAETFQNESIKYNDPFRYFWNNWPVILILLIIESITKQNDESLGIVCRYK